MKKNVTLQADLLACAGDGLVVGAPNVRIDLNGHRIAGRTEIGLPATPGSVGIRINGYDGVRVEDSQPDEVGGAIYGFVHSIVATDADQLSIISVVAYSVQLVRSHGAIIRTSTIIGEGTGAPCDPLRASAALRIVDSNGATIRGNWIGLGEYGLVLQRSHNNVVQGNESDPVGSDGNNCSGIVLLDADRNQLLRNTTANDADGIFVDAASARTIIDGNYAVFNYDDGIDVENPTTTIRNTVSNRNRDLGIEAVPGVVASGNTAKANGNPLQCLNVVCS